MIKKISIILPVIVFFTFFFFVWFEVKKPNSTKQLPVQEKIDDTNEQLTRQKNIFGKFYDENKKFLDKDFFENIIANKYKKKYKMKDLEEITKSAIVLKTLTKLVKQSNKLFEREEILPQVAEEKNKFDAKLKFLIDIEKQKMYKYFGSAIHPADKYFLDSLND